MTELQVCKNGTGKNMGKMLRTLTREIMAAEIVDLGLFFSNYNALRGPGLRWEFAMAVRLFPQSSFNSETRTTPKD